MQLHYQRSVRSNFGDALNEWLWRACLPGLWEDDGTVFVGIGTILDDSIPKAPVRIVLGTGAGYAPLPRDIGDASWRIYGVRGPLTARVLGLSQTAALTDPAILLCEFDEFKRRQGDAKLFVPHWKSLPFGNWETICDELGLEFVDPCSDSRAVVEKIASARLVIAESLHAAIIADAFRIPWIPVALSREVSAFKWADWTLSKGLRYSPVCLTPSTAIEALRDDLLRGSAFEAMFSFPHRSREALPPLDFFDLGRLVDEFQIICERQKRKGDVAKSKIVEAVCKRAAGIARKAREAAWLETDERQTARAREQLHALSQQSGVLSSNAQHSQALSRMHDALSRLQKDHALGFRAAA